MCVCHFLKNRHQRWQAITHLFHKLKHTHPVEVDYPAYEDAIDAVMAARGIEPVTLEASAGDPGPCRVVTGIGINIDMPEDFGAAIDQPWTDLASRGVRPGRNRLASRVLEEVMVWAQKREQNLQDIPVALSVVTAAEIEARIRAALAYHPPERLVVAPDCGMKYLSRTAAFGKLRNMAQAARELSEGNLSIHCRHQVEKWLANWRYFG